MLLSKRLRSSSPPSSPLDQIAAKRRRRSPTTGYSPGSSSQEQQPHVPHGAGPSNWFHQHQQHQPPPSLSMTLAYASSELSPHLASSPSVPLASHYPPGGLEYLQRQHRQYHQRTSQPSTDYFPTLPPPLGSPINGGGLTAEDDGLQTPTAMWSSRDLTAAMATSSISPRQQSQQHQHRPHKSAHRVDSDLMEDEDESDTWDDPGEEADDDHEGPPSVPSPYAPMNQLLRELHRPPRPPVSSPASSVLHPTPVHHNHSQPSRPPFIHSSSFPSVHSSSGYHPPSEAAAFTPLPPSGVLPPPTFAQRLLAEESVTRQRYAETNTLLGGLVLERRRGRGLFDGEMDEGEDDDE